MSELLTSVWTRIEALPHVGPLIGAFHFSLSEWILERASMD